MDQALIKRSKVILISLLLIGNDYQTFDNGLGYNKGGIGLGLSICK